MGRKIDKVQDVETLYGTVHVLSGYSELLACTITSSPEEMPELVTIFDHTL